MLVNAVNRGEGHHRRPSRIVHLRTFAVNFLLNFWVHGESEKNDEVFVECALLWIYILRMAMTS
jgi:hypothetical protein